MSITSNEAQALDAMMGGLAYLLTEAGPDEVAALTRGIQTCASFTMRASAAAESAGGN